MPSTPYHLVTKHSDNHHKLKDGAGVLTSVSANGAGSSATPFPIYAKFYDSSGTPDLSTAVPIWVTAIQMGLQSPNTVPPGGLTFTDGLHMFVVGGIQDTDDTDVANGDAVVDVAFQ